MAKDGTNRGGRRAGAGRKPAPLAEKLAEDGRATRVVEPADFQPLNVDGHILSSAQERTETPMPSLSAHLTDAQAGGEEFPAAHIFEKVWLWLAERGATGFVPVHLVESFAHTYARHIQCEREISRTGLLGQHPTTKAAIATPYAQLSREYLKQANMFWYEIYNVLRTTSTREISGAEVADEVMERLLD